MKKFVVVGIGDFGYRMAESLHRNGALTALCDTDEAKRALAEAFNCSFYTSFDSMLASKSADAILIATPTGYHAEQAIKALQAGFDVLVASPLCLTTAAVWQMIETAKFSRQQLLVIEGSDVIDRLEVSEREDLDFRLQCVPNTNRNPWQQEPFPGGSIFHNEGYPYLSQLVENFGSIQQVTAKDGAYWVEMERASGLLEILEQPSHQGTTLKVRALERKASADHNVSTNYKDLLPASINIQHPLDVAPVFAAIEKLEKSINPQG